jgi:Nif-specific regulatory protein
MSYEKELIAEALKRNNGNMSAAARELGISARVIHYKIKQLGL